MNKKFFILPVMFALLQSGAFAQGSSFQIGVILVEPTGFAAKWWLDSRSAFDFAFSGSIGENTSSFYAHSDFLFHLFDKITVDGGRLPLYWGLGVNCQGMDPMSGSFDFSMGGRIPLGVSYIYGESLFDIFFEMVPTLMVVPDHLLSLKGAMGFRLYI